MISFEESTWDQFCKSIIQGTEPRVAIKWITERRHVSEYANTACEHTRTREISIANGGMKKFCVACNIQLA